MKNTHKLVVGFTMEIFFSFKQKILSGLFLKKVLPSSVVPSKKIRNLNISLKV